MTPRVLVYALLLFMAAISLAQPKKSAAPPAVSPAAKICDDPYQVTGSADGWPEGPVYILYHRDKSKLPWAKNPAIRVPGLEAPTASAARTLVCIEETLLEAGRYDSGAPAYSPSWDITLVRMSDRKVFFGRVGFYGKEPPGVKYHRGAGIGAAPVKLFTDWLSLVVGQKVARLKMRISRKDLEMHEVSRLVFSADGSRLAVAQEPRSSLGGTPPSPVTVFNVATGNKVASWHVDYLVGPMALSASGTMVALGRYGHPEVWDVASARLVHKLDTGKAESLLFGPNDALGVAGNYTLGSPSNEADAKAAAWDVTGERVIQSGAGARILLSPAGEWVTVGIARSGVTVRTLNGERLLATFPAIADNDKLATAGEPQSMAAGSLLNTRIAAAGAKPADQHSVSLPNLGVDMIYDFAPAPDGFVFANSDGIVGVASAASPQPRAFATDLTAIHAVAVSRDGKLVAVGDSSGNVSVWDLL